MEIPVSRISPRDPSWVYLNKNRINHRTIVSEDLLRIDIFPVQGSTSWLSRLEEEEVGHPVSVSPGGGGDGEHGLTHTPDELRVHPVTQHPEDHVLAGIRSRDVALKPCLPGGAARCSREAAGFVRAPPCRYFHRRWGRPPSPPRSGTRGIRRPLPCALSCSTPRHKPGHVNNSCYTAVKSQLYLICEKDDLGPDVKELRVQECEVSGNRSSCDSCDSLTVWQLTWVLDLAGDWLTAGRGVTWGRSASRRPAPRGEPPCIHSSCSRCTRPWTESPGSADPLYEDDGLCRVDVECQVVVIKIDGT